MSTSADLPFVAAPAGDLALLEPVAIAAARHWARPSPRLLHLGMNAVFAAGDDVVLRVSRPSAPPSAAIDLATMLRDAGIAVPRPMRDDVFVRDGITVFAFERIHPSGAPIDWPAIGAMVRRVHELDVDVIPAAYPLPRGTSFPWWDMDTLLRDVGPRVDATALAAMWQCVERHRPTLVDAVDVPTVVCHGDIHPGNVIQSIDGPVLLDWDLLCREHVGWDHAPMMHWTQRWGGDPGWYAAFAEGYGADLRGNRFADAFADLRLLAATLMRVRAGLTDPVAAAEAELRLRWWRGDPDAPPWTAA